MRTVVTVFVILAVVTCSHLTCFANETLITAMHNAHNDLDMKKFVDYLNTYAFQPVSPTLQKESKISAENEEYKATEIIYKVLKSTIGVNCMEGRKLFGSNDAKAKGNIDLLIGATGNNKMSYAIEMKFQKGAVLALLKLIGYVVENLNSFRSATNFSDSMLVGLNIRRMATNGQLRINEWVMVPYREAIIWINKLESSENDRDQFLKDLKFRLRRKYPQLESQLITKGIIRVSN